MRFQNYTLVIVALFIFSFCTHKNKDKNEVLNKVEVKKKSDCSLEIGSVYKGYDTSVFQNYIEIKVGGDINQDKLIDSVIYLKSIEYDSLSTVLFLLKNKDGHFIIAAKSTTVLPYSQFGASGTIKNIYIENNEIKFSVYWGISNFRIEHISTFVYNTNKKDWNLTRMEFIEEQLDFGKEASDEIKILSNKSTIKTKKDFGEISFSKFDYDLHSINMEE